MEKSDGAVDLLGVPFVERLDVDELILSVGPDHDGVVLASTHQSDAVAQIPFTITVSYGGDLAGERRKSQRRSI